MTNKSLWASMQTNYKTVQTHRPLIICITNHVTMHWVASILLSIHAAPVMSACADELDDMLKQAHALYINIGTLDTTFLKTALHAAALAKQYKIPVILDPVGCGFTKIRTDTANALLPFANIVRGNASEIMALHTNKHSTRGVDAIHTVDQSKRHAQHIAKTYDCTCVVTGKKDFICDKNKSIELSHGTSMMTHITGMGCALGAVIAAFHAVHRNVFEASTHAILFYTLTGELIADKQKALGQFSASFIDQLHIPDWNALENIYQKENKT